MAAGGMYLAPGMHTMVLNTTIEICNKSYPAMALGTVPNITDVNMLPATLNLTQSVIKSTESAGMLMGRNVHVASHFMLWMDDPTRSSCESAGGYLWTRTNCSRGEFISNAAGGYCVPCSAYTYLLTAKQKGGQPDGEQPCQPAGKHAHAPGGAVLVPNSKYWHGDWEHHFTPPHYNDTFLQSLVKIKR